MTDLRQAAQQALEALESLQGGCTDHDDGTVEAITVWCPEVIDALRSALEQQQAEPVSELQKRYLESEKAFQQQPEALQAMNDQLITGTSIMLDGKRVDPASVYKQAEPVAWMDKHGNIDHGLDAILEPEGWKPLYTTPPQRHWVGLTDEQLDDIAVVARRGNLHDLRIAIEAKLKERNNG